MIYFLNPFSHATKVAFLKLIAVCFVSYNLYIQFMKEWFRPLMAFEKFKLAGKILRGAWQSRISVESDNKNKPHLTMNYYEIPVYYVFTKNELKKPERIIEAVDILSGNEHIIKIDSRNFYDIKMKCTIKGERALNDGYYTKEIWKFWGKIIGATGLGSLVIWLLSRFL